jgi:hypothetical protein
VDTDRIRPVRGAIIPLWPVIATAVGGPRLAMDTPRGAWVAVYLYSFLAVLALACAIPHRPVVAASKRPTTEPVDQLSRERGALSSP